MKIIERRVLRGPNIHSHRPCFLAVLDLEDLDEVSSAQLPGFTDAPRVTRAASSSVFTRVPTWRTSSST